MSASRDRSAPARRGVRFWSRWWLENLCILGAVMVAGLPLFIPIGLVGWGTGEDPLAYVFLWIYLPFSATAYLALLGAIGSRARRPRVWAFALTPIFWGFVPIFAIAIDIPAVAVSWVAYLTYAGVVRLPRPSSGGRAREWAEAGPLGAPRA